MCGCPKFFESFECRKKKKKGEEEEKVLRVSEEFNSFLNHSLIALVNNNSFTLIEPIEIGGYMMMMMMDWIDMIDIFYFFVALFFFFQKLLVTIISWMVGNLGLE